MKSVLRKYEDLSLICLSSNLKRIYTWDNLSHTKHEKNENRKMSS